MARGGRGAPLTAGVVLGTGMYEEFYSLQSRPFLSAPDPSFLYWSENHALAFAMLTHGLANRAPLTVVTGEIGAGKTTLLRQLLRETPDDLVIGLLSNMQAGQGELLHWVLMALDQPIGREPYVECFKRFQDFVIDAYASGRRVALIIDEAQNLSVEQLEELRMLSNINADGAELLQLFLVGQPQLRALLARPELRQFSQRIVSDFHLDPLGGPDVERYILHRLDCAGARWRIFTQDACAEIHRATRGVARLVNILCDMSLIYGFAAEQKVIDVHLVGEFLEAARRRGIYQQFVAAPPAKTAEFAR